MLALVNRTNQHRYLGALTAHFRLRHQVFFDRLGWEVTSNGELEVDYYDALGPDYILWLDEDGHVAGCLRYLPSTGPNMLNNTFPALLPEGPVTDPSVMEISRFAVNLSVGGRTPTGMNRVTAELLLGAMEYARLKGLHRTVQVVDIAMERILRRACRWTRLSAPVELGRGRAVAGFCEVGEAAHAHMRTRTGIDRPVLFIDNERRAA